VQAVIDENGIAPHLCFNTRVTDCVWDETRHLYTLTTASGTTAEFQAVVSAIGLLNVPRYPEWPGLETFRGPKFHTARWEHQHDLAGKRVAVVGNGSTASQVVPALTRLGAEVTHFAREPAYVLPKGERDLSAAERRALAGKWGLRRRRAQLFWQIERGMSVRDPHSRRQHEARAAYLRYRDEVFAARPDLRDLLTPAYPFACKRPILSTDFLPALAGEKVRVVPRSVVSVTPAVVVDESGAEHAADVLVMATGFQPWSFLHTLRLVGRGGRSIHGVWGDEPEAFLGIQVPGFPNFFMMYGPNTNYYCVTFMLERQAGYIARAIARLARGRATAIEVRPGITAWYNRHVDRALSRKTLEGNCHNYYHSASGRNVVTWPWRGTVYLLATRLGRLAQTTRRLVREPRRAHLEPERRRLAPAEAAD
jgi:cation diffusion facilitator CzcD-associated flavoprotein CzcO